jgi:uncharacterized membrane protein
MKILIFVILTSFLNINPLSNNIQNHSITSIKVIDNKPISKKKNRLNKKIKKLEKRMAKNNGDYNILLFISLILLSIAMILAILAIVISTTLAPWALLLSTVCGLLFMILVSNIPNTYTWVGLLLSGCTFLLSVTLFPRDR